MLVAPQGLQPSRNLAAELAPAFPTVQASSQFQDLLAQLREAHNRELQAARVAVCRELGLNKGELVAKLQDVELDLGPASTRRPAFGSVSPTIISAPADSENVKEDKERGGGRDNQAALMRTLAVEGAYGFGKVNGLELAAPEFGSDQMAESVEDMKRQAEMELIGLSLLNPSEELGRSSSSWAGANSRPRPHMEPLGDCACRAAPLIQATFTGRGGSPSTKPVQPPSENVPPLMETPRDHTQDPSANGTAVMKIPAPSTGSTCAGTSPSQEVQHVLKPVCVPKVPLGKLTEDLHKPVPPKAPLLHGVDTMTCTASENQDGQDDASRMSTFSERRSRRTRALGASTFQKQKSGMLSEGEEEEDKDVQKTQLLDVCVALAIMSNAAILGFSLDNDPDWPGWSVIEYFFTVFFIYEMLYKIRMFGLQEYFAGADWAWNNFDAVIVGVALIDIAMGSLSSASSGPLSEVKKVKIFRLGRLARLVRLLRFRIFKELKTMIRGVFVGLRVLFWAIVLFFSFLYILGLAMRQTIGDGLMTDGLNMRELEYTRMFDTVDGAMFTLFRCFTDGCAASDGTPLQHQLVQIYGSIFLIGYMLIFLFVTIGLFNLIMAIFVDNVMESTRQRKQDQRGQDRVEMMTRLRSLVHSLIAKEQGTAGRINNMAKGKTKTSVFEEEMALARRSFWDMVQSWCGIGSDEKQAEDGATESSDVNDEEVIVTREVFCKWLHDESMTKMLEDMDIAVANRYELFDVLDADLSGELGVDEVVEGLMKLRGPAEKSDAVASLLCVRVVLQLLQTLQGDLHRGFALAGIDCEDKSLKEEPGQIPHDQLLKSSSALGETPTSPHTDGFNTDRGSPPQESLS